MKNMNNKTHKCVSWKQPDKSLNPRVRIAIISVMGKRSNFSRFAMLLGIRFVKAE